MEGALYLSKCMDKLIITVKEIKNNCPVYHIGDKIVLEEGYRLNLNETNNVCMHSLASIMPYYIALYSTALFIDSRFPRLTSHYKKRLAI